MWSFHRLEYWEVGELTLGELGVWGVGMDISSKAPFDSKPVILRVQVKK